MSKKWYPVIDYENCTECGACVAKCTHGVYESNTNKPKVIYPEGCIDECRGCQSLCPTNSIEYVGDSGNDASENCGCGCSCSC